LEEKMTAEMISGIASSILYIIMSYVPKADGTWESLTSNQRKLIILVLTLCVAIGAVLLACTGLASEFGLTITCDKSGVVAVIKSFFVALIANQAIYRISPETSAKTAAGVDRVARALEASNK